MGRSSWPGRFPSWLLGLLLSLTGCAASLLDVRESEDLIESARRLEEQYLECFESCDAFMRGAIAGRIRTLTAAHPDLEPDVWAKARIVEDRVLAATVAGPEFDADVFGLSKLYGRWPAPMRVATLLEASRRRLSLSLHRSLLDQVVQSAPRAIETLDDRDVAMLQELIASAPAEHNATVARFGQAETSRLEQYRLDQALSFAEALRRAGHERAARAVLATAATGIPGDGCARLRTHAQELELKELDSLVAGACE